MAESAGQAPMGEAVPHRAMIDPIMGPTLGGFLIDRRL
jgi:hypothetical protein